MKKNIDYPHIFKEWRITLFIAFLVIVVGLVLRFYNLTNLPVFGDEAIYIRWAQIMIAEPTMRFISLSDGKQPLFMWGIMPFLKIFDDPLFAGRILSALTGVVTALGVFVLSYLITNKTKPALMAVFIYLIIPFSVFFERLAMADSMLSMFGIWSLIFTFLIVKYKRLDLAIIFGFILSGALLTKSPALYFSLLIPLSIVINYFNKRNLKETFFITILIGLGYLIAYGFYNFILHLGPNYHMIALRNKDYVFPISHLWENPTDPFIFHFDRAKQWYLHYGTWPLAILFIAGLLTGLKQKTSFTLLIFAWFIVPVLASSMFARSFTTRYIFYTLPYYVVISSFVLLNAATRKIIISSIVTFLFLLIIIFSGKFYLTYITDYEKTPLSETDRSGFLVEWTAGKGIREISEIIIEEYNKNPDKKIVVGTEGYFGTLPDGLQIYLSKYPQITVIGVGIDLNEIPIQLKESKQFGNTTYLVINSSRLKMDPNSPGLKALTFFEKPDRNPQSHEFAIHGPSDRLYLFEIAQEL